MLFVSRVWVLLFCLLYGDATYAASNFAAGVPKFSCADSKAIIEAKNPSVVIDDSGNEYYAGTRQEAIDNQDPVVVAYDSGGGLLWCNQLYETGGVDGRAIGLLYDDTDDVLYAAFTVDGGDGTATGIETHTTNGWLNNYGMGGTSGKVTVILRLDPTTGNVYQSGGNPVGTFIIAIRPSDNATNTLRATNMSYDAVTDRLTVTASSAFSPLEADGVTLMTGSGTYTITFAQDLKTVPVPTSLISGGSAVSGDINSWLGVLFTALALIGWLLWRGRDNNYASE